MQTTDKSEMLRVVEKNIAALVERSREADLNRTFEQRCADAITHAAGSMTFVYIHLVFYALWILINIGWIPGPRFDPTLVILAMEASVEAIFLSTFILITQNRMAQLAEKRAELDLQISLLAEHEITRILKLVAEVAQHMQIADATSPEVEALQKDIQPEDILNEIERRQPGTED